MSGLAIHFEKDQITFSTDSLVTADDRFSGKRINSLSKVDFYQHLKCCVVALGYSRLRSDFHEFINELVLSDIVDLVDITEKYFLDIIDVEKYNPSVYIDQEENDHLGSLYIMGFSDKLNRLCAYRISIERYSLSVIELKTDNQLFIHPPISKESKARIISEFQPRTDVKPQEIMVEFVKQMAADTLVQEDFTVAVGMEIHTTQLSVINGQFICAFGIPVRLERFEEELKEMARDQENKLFIEASRKRIERTDRMFKQEETV